LGEATPSKLPLSNFRANSRPQSMWVATQDALMVAGTVGSEQGIWRVPLNGDPPQRLKLNADGVIEARLSGDGRAVAHTVQPARGRELWMLRGAT
jgi:hypothetical protein